MKDICFWHDTLANVRHLSVSLAVNRHAGQISVFPSQVWWEIQARTGFRQRYWISILFKILDRILTLNLLHQWRVLLAILLHPLHICHVWPFDIIHWPKKPTLWPENLLRQNPKWFYPEPDSILRKIVSCTCFYFWCIAALLTNRIVKKTSRMTKGCLCLDWQ